MEPIVPSDDALLKEIQRIQSSQGAEIGLPKIYDHIKAEHPLWMFGMKRLRNIRKAHDLAPTPPGSKDDEEDTPSSSDTVKLNMFFRVPAGETADNHFFFKKDIPAAFCRPDAPREVTAPFLSGVIDICEAEILAKHKWRCGFCRDPATFFYGVPSITLVDSPPTVQSVTLPLCTVRSKCMQEALLWAKRATEGLQNSKGDFSVVQVSGRR